MLFADFADAVQASRELAQSGLHPANCRLLGHDEALMSGSGDGSRAILVLGFESADHELGRGCAGPLEICAGHGGEAVGEPDVRRPRRRRRGLAGFVPAGGYLRDGLVPLGLISETFETADHLGSLLGLHAAVTAAARRCAGVRRR